MNEWKPIGTAPTFEPVLVSNATVWTLARQVWMVGMTLQMRWPFVKRSGEWRWVFSAARLRPIDFEPTHWAPAVTGPPSLPHKRRLCLS